MDVHEQDDWAVFREVLNKEISDRAMTTKAVLWTAIGALSIVVIALSILVSNIKSDVRLLRESNGQLQSELSEVKALYEKVSGKCASAQLAYSSDVKFWRGAD